MVWPFTSRKDSLATVTEKAVVNSRKILDEARINQIRIDLLRYKHDVEILEGEEQKRALSERQLRLTGRISDAKKETENIKIITLQIERLNVKINYANLRLKEIENN